MKNALGSAQGVHITSGTWAPPRAFFYRLQVNKTSIHFVDLMV